MHGVQGQELEEVDVEEACAEDAEGEAAGQEGEVAAHAPVVDRGVISLSVLASALAFAGGTLAASNTLPSDRSCLVAWNSTGNEANRLRLLAQRPISGLRLLPGAVGTDTWSKGSPPTQTSAPACLLSLAKPGKLQVVTGLWRGAGVRRWSFGRSIATSKPFVANVRLLSDGRVTKLYRR